MSEAKLEAKCKKYAESKGCFLFKWVSPGHRGALDRLLIAPHVIIPIEFKSPGGNPYTKLTAQQRLMLDRLWALSIDSACAINDYEVFCSLVDRFTAQ